MKTREEEFNARFNALLLLLLLYTLFIVEIKTGKMPNNIGPTVNNMLKDIVEKKKKKKNRYKRKRERKKNDGRLVATNRYQSSKHWKTYVADNIYCKA